MGLLARARAHLSLTRVQAIFGILAALISIGGALYGYLRPSKPPVPHSGEIVATWSDSSGTGGDASGDAVKSQVLTLGTAGPTDIDLSNNNVSETQIDNVPIATLSATGALNTSFTFTILDDPTGGAMRRSRSRGDRAGVDVRMVALRG